MPRIAGVDLDLNKRTDIALTKLYGVGRVNVINVLAEAGVKAAGRVRDLTEEEINKLQLTINKIKVEGDLRQEIQANIKSLKEIGAYRGLRHTRNLPSRGQRTRSNARTKRGKRVTIGAIKKKLAEKMGLLTKEVPGQKTNDKK